MPDTRQFASDERVLHLTEWMTRWRAIALLLSVPATLCAAACLLFMISPWGWLIFGPGYVVTVGYYWRAWGDPPRRWAKAVWLTSLVVQGGWLAVVGAMFVGSLVRSETRADAPRDFTFVVWWLVPTLVSAFGLRHDEGVPTAT